MNSLSDAYEPYICGVIFSIAGCLLKVLKIHVIKNLKVLWALFGSALKAQYYLLHLPNQLNSLPTKNMIPGYVTVHHSLTKNLNESTSIENI